jgi:hypothetical protein
LIFVWFYVDMLGFRFYPLGTAFALNISKNIAYIRHPFSALVAKILVARDSAIFWQKTLAPGGGCATRGFND